MEAQSGGNATVRYADMQSPPVGLGAKAGAGNVTFERVNIDGASTPMDIAGGTVLVDHVNFTTDVRSSGSARITAPNVEIRDSLLRTGNASSPDFFIINTGGGVYAHHNDFDGEHCAIHINAGAGATRFENNVFHNNSYTIMKYGMAASGNLFKELNISLTEVGMWALFDSMPSTADRPMATATEVVSAKHSTIDTRMVRLTARSPAPAPVGPAGCPRC